MIVQRRGIVTVPGEMGREQCWPKRVMFLEDRHLRRELCRMASEMNRQRALEGLAYREADDTHVYGPFPTAERLAAMLCEADMGVTQPEQGGLVLERDSSSEAFSHYLIVANYEDRAAPPAMGGVLLDMKGVAHGRTEVAPALV